MPAREDEHRGEDGGAGRTSAREAEDWGEGGGAGEDRTSALERLHK
jgi:hypothetical protein